MVKTAVWFCVEFECDEDEARELAGKMLRIEEAKRQLGPSSLNCITYRYIEAVVGGPVVGMRVQHRVTRQLGTVAYIAPRCTETWRSSCGWLRDGDVEVTWDITGQSNVTPAPLFWSAWETHRKSISTVSSSTVNPSAPTPIANASHAGSRS